MSYRLEQNETVVDGIRRIATEQLDKALSELDDGDLNRHETVHQLRKRCKKLRALVRLVRPGFDGYKQENKFYRDAARALSYVRDATAIIETHDDLMDHFEDQIDREAFKSTRDALLEQRKQIADEEAELDNRLEVFREQLVEGKRRLDDWELDDKGFDAIAGGLNKTYSRCVDRMEDACDDASTEKLHEFRKRAKYHWYHLRLLRDVWKPVVKKQCDEADDLADVLGDDHDLAVYADHLLADPKRFGERDDLQALLGLIDRRRGQLQYEAEPIARRLFAESPTRFVERFETYWQTWRRRRKTSSKLAEPMVTVGA